MRNEVQVQKRINYNSINKIYKYHKLLTILLKLSRLMKYIQEILQIYKKNVDKMSCILNNFRFIVN